MLKRVVDTNKLFQPQHDAASSIMKVIGTSPIVSVLRRQWPMIAASTLLCILLGIGYILTAAPRFTASTAVMIDLRNNKPYQSVQAVGDAPMDSSAVDSQVEVLKSESVALSVIRELKLTDDPEFVGGRSNSVLGSVMSLLNILNFAEPSETQLERRAVRVFARNLQIRRVGLSYVINVNYTSYDRQKAANIANTIADAYMVGELNARYQATKRASRWLQDRIAELRTQASEAEAAVQTFKSENNIVDTGRGLMSEQQLADVNTQMVAARAATAEAKARLDRIDQISREDLPDATVTDALRNDVINRLRAQYLDISARASDWASRFGQTHIAVVNLRKQMQEIRKSMSDELRRIAETYRSDYEIARVREQSLESSLSSLVGQAATTGQAQIKLRDLESSAQTYRNMYDNFLQRFTEATQQQTFPINEARVITAATEPLQKSWPISTYVLAGSALIGLFFGVGGAFLLEYMDTMLRTPQQVEQLLGLDCLGIIPKITDAMPAASGGKGNAENPPAALTPAGMMRYVVDAPFSRFAETLRSAKFASDFKNVDESSKVIGVISALPGEGKTTVAGNLAELIAQSGAKVLLIDADMRNPSLTRLLMTGAKEGLLEVLTGRRRFQEVLWKEKQTGVDLLPTVLTGPIPHTSELISSKGMMALLKEARMHYDYIVLDLPPAAPVIDVRAVSSLIDGFLIVVEWGRTSRDTIQSSIIKNDEIKSRTLGVVLNKANAASLKRIEDSTGQYYGSYYNS